MTYATFNGNPWKQQLSHVTILLMPVMKAGITFYNELLTLVQYIPKHNILIIGRDINPYRRIE